MSEKIIEQDGKRYKKVKKGEYLNKNTYKTKRHHPVRWILITLFCLLIVAPVGFIFGAFYDPSTKNVADTTEKFQENFQNNLTKSLTNMNNGVFTFELDNDFLDSMLVVAQKQILTNPSLSKYLKKIYCNINGNNYDFIIEAQLSFFKTRLHLQTVLNYDQASESYIFKIKNIVLGRLPLGNLSKKILSKFISEDQIKEGIHSIFPQCNVDLNNMEMTYKRDKFKEDIGIILSTIDTDIMNDPLSSVLLSLYSSIESTSSFTDKISITLDFKNLKDPKYTIRNAMPGDFKTNIAKHSEKVANLLNDKNVGLAAEESETIFKYFITGYSSAAQEIFNKKQNVANACKTYITAIEEKSTELNEYKGDKVYVANILSKDNLAKEIVVPGTIDISTLKNGINMSFSESSLSKYIRSTAMMGFTTVMPLRTGDNYTLAYVLFDDFNVNIETNEINIIGDINLNGVQIPITLESNVPSISGSNRTLTISPNKIYISDKELTDKAKNNMLSFIEQGFSSGDIFSFDKNTKSFLFKISAIDVPSTVTYSALINGVLKNQDFDFESTHISKDDIDFTCSALHKSGDTSGSLNFYIRYKN